MTIQEKGQKLIKEADRIYGRDLTLAWQQEDYNLTVRRAQEVVELALKGALQILGVDYPKVHDVGHLLTEQAQKKQCPVDPYTLKRIEEASQWLSSIRNTSFYGEGEYTKKDAQQAYDEAEFTLETIKKHFPTAENPAENC